MTPDILASKCVIVVDEALPVGLAVNAASLVALTLGQRFPALIGPDVKDASGTAFWGVCLIPVPVLKAPAAQVAEIHAAAAAIAEISTFGFSTLAQGCKTYDEYIAKMAATPAATLTYSALGLLGPKKPMNRLVGNLPLLR